METTTVYRVAHRTVINQISGTHMGPYADAGSDDDFTMPDLDCNISDTHPTPWCDPLLRSISGDEVCGFSNLDGVFEWFPEHELERLRDCDYQIQIWETGAARFGMNQVLFMPHQSTLVQTLDL